MVGEFAIACRYGWYIDLRVVFPDADQGALSPARLQPPPAGWRGHVGGTVLDGSAVLLPFRQHFVGAHARA